MFFSPQNTKKLHHQCNILETVQD